MNIRFPQKMRINGTYLEDTVPGYHTLEVTGRDSIEMDIDSVSFARVDGERYQGKRATVRTLTVRFVIEGYGPADFASKLAKLKTALKVTEAQLIFDDEPNMYWIGTPSKLDPEQIGPSACKGEIEITCSDPYKYGLVERAVDFVDGTAEIYYGGTEETRPKIHAVFPEDTGFISFTKDGKTLMFGDETDDGSIPTDPDANVDYVSARDGAPTAGERWSYNDGILPYVNNPTLATGTMAVTATARNLYANSFGTNNNSWHGPCLTYHLEGSKSECEFSAYFSLGARTNNQCGLVQFSMASDSANVAAVSIFKGSKGSLNGGYDLYVKGTRKKNISVSVAEGNKATTNGACTIKKKGSTITFSIGGNQYQFTDASLADVKVTRLTIFFARKAAETQLSINHVTGFRFTSPDEAMTVRTFWSGDMIDVDCESAEVQVNDVPAYQIGRLRNPWDSFKLTPGKNVITMDRSDWAAMPSAHVTYREVYT